MHVLKYLSPREFVTKVRPVSRLTYRRTKQRSSIATRGKSWAAQYTNDGGECWLCKGFDGRHLLQILHGVESFTIQMDAFFLWNCRSSHSARV